jgi:UDP-N-acetylglucosamine:LPS N-acetylglucosamine transferase
MSPSSRVLLVSSSGGVLLELLALEPWWSKYRTSWAVVKATDTISALSGRHVFWIHDASLRRPFGVPVSFITAWRIIRRERPELIVSAGSGPAVFFFFLARVMGIPTFWVVTMNVLTSPGVAASICSPLSSRTIVQHRNLLNRYPHAVFLGQLY